MLEARTKDQENKLYKACLQEGPISEFELMAPNNFKKIYSGYRNILAIDKEGEIWTILDK